MQVSDATENAAPRRGVVYLLVVGVGGVIVAVYFVSTGFAQVRADDLLRGVGSLSFGALIGTAGVRVLKLWRKARIPLKSRTAGEPDA